MQNMCGEPPPELASEPETEGSGVMDRDAVVEECAAWHDNQAKTLRDMTFRPNPEVDGGIMDTLRLDRADEHDGYAAAIRALKSGAAMSPAAMVTREDVLNPVIKPAVQFLQLDSDYTDAKVLTSASPCDDALYRKAHDLGERRETARRVLADAVIADSPELETLVRKVVQFPANVDSGILALLRPTHIGEDGG